MRSSTINRIKSDWPPCLLLALSRHPKPYPRPSPLPLPSPIPPNRGRHELDARGRELRLCSSRVTSGRSIFRTRWYPARPPEMRPTNETGKVRSRLLDVMDREANAHTVDVRSCRRHASSMIGFVPVEVVSRWCGSCRRRASQRYTLLNSLRCWAVAGWLKPHPSKITASLLRSPGQSKKLPLFEPT